MTEDEEDRAMWEDIERLMNILQRREKIREAVSGRSRADRRADSERDLAAAERALGLTPPPDEIDLALARLGVRLDALDGKPIVSLAAEGKPSGRRHRARGLLQIVAGPSSASGAHPEVKIQPTKGEPS